MLFPTTPSFHRRATPQKHKSLLILRNLLCFCILPMMFVCFQIFLPSAVCNVINITFIIFHYLFSFTANNDFPPCDIGSINYDFFLLLILKPFPDGLNITTHFPLYPIFYTSLLDTVQVYFLS